MRTRPLLVLCLSAGLSFASGCADEGSDLDLDNDTPLSDPEALFEGAPGNDTLPDENKADAVYPSLYTNLLTWQSPVKSQGRRGVCSIFSTVALMEHLYLKEGTLPNPDFSEQYLQWSAKFEVGAFPDTSGSNARANLDAIHRFGIVDEATYPYESSQWGTGNDPACTGGEGMPTRCYTNGEPPDDVKAATKYKLPIGRWLNTNSIKAHMTTRNTGVIVGLTFFYQSWNHRASKLPVNMEYWRNGYVLYPNAEDKRTSLEERAGHSVLLVGWDDTLEVQSVDETGAPVMDESGAAVMEKGFFIFKNSWGTGSFGRDNPHGDGYGYISMRYVEEYGSAYISDVPEVEVPAEVCDDGVDNDRDGTTDCEDLDCSEHAACSSSDVELVTYDSSEVIAIPDNNPAGISSSINVPRSGPMHAIDVAVNITHTYRGDLRVTLQRGDQAVVLHNRTGSADDDLVASYQVDPGSFTGTDMAGEWRLKVEDLAAADLGTLNSWSVSFLTGVAQ